MASMSIAIAWPWYDPNQRLRELQNPTFHLQFFFLKVEVDRGTGPLSIAGLKTKNRTQEARFCNSWRR
jgi:hypothetical protein